MKGNTKIILAIVLLALIGIGAYFGYTKYTANKAKAIAKAKDVHYEVLDGSVLQSDMLKKLISDNKDSNCVKSASDDKFTYILISGGKQDTTGYGMNLKKLNGELKQVVVDYSVVPPVNKTNVEKKESHPHMVIRIPKDSRAIKGNLVKE